MVLDRFRNYLFKLNPELLKEVDKAIDYPEASEFNNVLERTKMASADKLLEAKPAEEKTFQPEESKENVERSISSLRF